MVIAVAVEFVAIVLLVALCIWVHRMNRQLSADVDAATDRKNNVLVALRVSEDRARTAERAASEARAERDVAAADAVACRRRLGDAARYLVKFRDQVEDLLERAPRSARINFSHMERSLGAARISEPRIKEAS